MPGRFVSALLVGLALQRGLSGERVAGHVAGTHAEGGLSAGLAVGGLSLGAEALFVLSGFVVALLVVAVGWLVVAVGAVVGGGALVVVVLGVGGDLGVEGESALVAFGGASLVAARVLIVVCVHVEAGVLVVVVALVVVVVALAVGIAAKSGAVVVEAVGAERGPLLDTDVFVGAVIQAIIVAIGTAVVAITVVLVDVEPRTVCINREGVVSHVNPQSLLLWLLRAVVNTAPKYVFVILVVKVGLCSIVDGRLLRSVDLLSPLNRAVFIGGHELPCDLRGACEGNDELGVSYIGLLNLGEGIGDLGSGDVGQGSEGKLFVGRKFSGVGDHLVAFEHEEAFVGHHEGRLFFGQH